MTMSEADREEWFSTDELSDMVRRAAARRAGLEPPVLGEVLWLWAPGQGPVAHVLVRRAPNVVQLPVREASSRGSR